MIEKNINNFLFIYNNKKLNKELELEKCINMEDKLTKKMNIIVLNMTNSVIESINNQNIIDVDYIKYIDNKDNDSINEINLVYQYNNSPIPIFGINFVKANKNNCSIICEGNTYEINQFFNIKNYIKDYNKDIIVITLIGIKKITNMSNMFSGCSSLISLPDISKIDTSNVTNMSHMFFGCKNLMTLPNISKWNTLNVINMSHMFDGCSSLTFIIDKLNWNTSNAVQMEYMFNECSSLSILLDLSEWNVMNVKNMTHLFSKCESLSYLSDISKRNTKNLTNVSHIFYGCRRRNS